MESLPKKVAQFVNKVNYSNSPYFCVYMDIYRNKPVLRTFAYQRTKTYGFAVQEIFREYLDHNEENDSLTFSYIGGYRIQWKNKKNNNCYRATPTYKFYKCYDKFWKPNLSVSVIQTEKEICDILSKYIPYFHLSYYNAYIDIMQYARLYIENPRLELLSKAGFSYLYNDKLMMKCGADKMKKIASWIKQNKSFMYSYLPNYKFIVSAIKNNQTGDEHLAEIRAMEGQKLFAQNEMTRTFEEVLYINKYIAKHGCDLQTYIDYLKARQKLNMASNEHSVLFPRELMRQHDYLTSIIDAKENKDLNKKLARKYNKFVKFAPTMDDFKIVVPKTVHEFIKWGNQLHNCVGSMGYDKKMASGDCIIVGVFVKNKIVECCELNKNKKIMQLRGDNNQPSEYHEEAEKLVNTFIQNMKLNLQCSC